ncbi:monovalent cation/H(+) antiporter subunit G [Mucisphaera calidilacus]|uniref:Na(+)/H(+) antiporter subunit G n=1 Tax=Mucisphaera calidilacus TaxID=2527982 RepID=A0A518BXA4_9BACT|nr:monovalent cation/H(+) antiporter subunit G [Mucisphaera calidilacus]QDU71574.1 Na(+)/H(+) antiporter subunit G [Mucisphaera calidilacus]
MIYIINDLLTLFFLLIGLGFMLIGAIGIVRLPDTYHRLHAASKCATLGLAGMLFAAVFNIGTLAVVTKAVVTLVFACVAVPVGSHILAKAALLDRAPMWTGTLDNEWLKRRRGK